MIGTGSFAARGVSALEFSKSPDKGTPCVRVTVELKSGPNSGERLDWVGWLTEATEGRTAESLALMGYDGKDLSSVTAKEFIAVVEHEAYVSKSGEEKTRPRIVWINDPTGGGRLDPMSTTEVAGAKEKLAKAIVAAKAKGGKPAGGHDVKF